MACNCTGACRLYGSCNGRPAGIAYPFFSWHTFGAAPARPTRRALYLEQAAWFERMGNENARAASLRAAERHA